MDLTFFTHWLQANAAILMGITMLVLLICYIAAQILAKKGWLVFTASKLDAGLLLSSPVVVLVGDLVYDASQNKNIGIILLLVGFGLLAVSVIFSIYYNMDNTWGMLLSVFGKLFVFWATLFLLMLLIALFIAYVIIAFARNRSNEGETIVLHYDSAIDAYVGYKR